MRTKTSLPRLNPIAKVAIERFITEVEAAEFHSRLFNNVLPELLRKALRIEKGEQS